MLIRFYCMEIHFSRMLYMIGIKEIRFFFDIIKSPSICKLHGAVIIQSVSIRYDAWCLVK